MIDMPPEFDSHSKASLASHEDGNLVVQLNFSGVDYK